MSVDKVEVRNFQSLKDVSLELGRLTVVVGPSNSGKSAMFRSLRGLVSNLRGSRYVTRGAKASVISVTTSEHKVTLERGDGVGSYRITNLESGKEETHTKLGGAVPDSVSAVLGIDPELSFVQQFSRPYLLDESGGESARVLGRLTNVDILFAASREASRRRTAHAAELKTREADLGRATERLAEFADLPAQMDILSSVEESLDKAEMTQKQISYLQEIVNGVEIASEVLRQAQSLVVEVVDLSQVMKLWGEFSSLLELMQEVNVVSLVKQEKELLVLQRKLTADQAHAKLHELTEQIGVCSECGSVRVKA
jgi:energy-coupling factor transporter ATP-binding protein EcfA2